MDKNMHMSDIYTAGLSEMLNHTNQFPTIRTTTLNPSATAVVLVLCLRDTVTITFKQKSHVTIVWPECHFAKYTQYQNC